MISEISANNAKTKIIINDGLLGNSKFLNMFEPLGIVFITKQENAKQKHNIPPRTIIPFLTKNPIDII